MSLPVLVGEAPSKSGDRYWMFPLSGAVGQRMCEWARIEPEPTGSRYGRYYWALRERFECVNVYDRYAESTPWSLPCARIAWDARLRTDYPDSGRHYVFVALGRRVAQAMGHTLPWNEWYRGSCMSTVVIPHPSGLNRMYNAVEVGARSGEVLREAMSIAAAMS